MKSIINISKFSLIDLYHNDIQMLKNSIEQIKYEEQKRFAVFNEQNDNLSNISKVGSLKGNNLMNFTNSTKK